MLEPILQGLRDVEGVQGAMIVDHTAAVVAHRAHTIYDLTVLQQVARSIANSIDSVQLIQDDWDTLTAQFGEGRLLLRNLRTADAKLRRYVLAVIADATLNVAFLSVALRVATGKLVAELDAAPVAPHGAGVPVPVASGSTGRYTIPDPTPPEVARSGLSWSGVSSGSGVGSSDVGVSDSASSTFLTHCTRALAASVGPMAKVFVKEGVRKVCGERSFSRGDGPALIDHLATQIDDPEERAAFERATRGL